MKKTKLTLVGKIVIFVFVLALVLGGVFLIGGFNFSKDDNDTPSKDTKTTQNSNVSNELPKNENSNNEINLSLTEKISWKPILDANGGLTTQPGSVYDKLGIKVNIKIDGDAVSISNDFIENNVNALAYTINRYAGTYKKFKDNNAEPIMPYIVDSSDGSDGIVVKEGINSVNDFIGKKIAVPNLTAAQTMIWWLMLKSDLNEDQIEKIKSNMTLYKSTVAASEAFFKGEADVVVTRQPYLTNAKNTPGMKVLFTTKSANNLILDGILFRKDFADQNPEVVSKFIDGALQSININTFDNIKTIDIFKDKTDEELNQMLTELKFSDYSANHNLLNGVSQDLFNDMNKVWNKIGESVDNDAASKAFSTKFIDGLSSKYTLEKVETKTVDEETRQKALSQDNDEALLKKSTTINFKSNSAKFVNEDEAKKALNEFINIAQFLDGAIIQIEGNIAGKDNSEVGKQLSLQRAKTVAEYLKQQGVDPSRFVVVGNGTSKQIASNDTEEGMKKNRRTDIVFKIVEE
ncbi:gp250 [Bacillus phage G]|uniref:Gp250 n=1 Tax=Bacillus phage G TaxID=2884420 RepID=G3M9Z1_9CAUD|nr:gp250 [Bacillus phage G]AEO93509.1 gp250 [Bacillus phage G]